jgi:hypothetical protein
MELNKEQIESLFRFTAKKYVHWYDLQVELVDHLASRIEEEMTAHKGLSFEKALGKVYNGFGIFGFANIVKEKELQLCRSSRKLWWQAFREFFGWPKILLLAASVWLIWETAHILPAYVILPLLFVFFIFSELRLWRIRKRTARLARPLLLMELSPLRFASGFIYIQAFWGINNSNQIAIFVLGIITLLCVLVNLGSFKAHRVVQAEAEALYPEAFA